MKSISHLFSYLNDINFPYVVLRNWDNLPDDYRLGEHSDLDLLVYDYDHFFEIFPKSQKVYSLPRVRTKIPIGNSFLYADIRYLGDDYYPLEFEKNILKSREKHPRGFYTPDYTHHTIALAYHAVHHKNSIAPEYRRHLGDSSVEELLSCLKESSVGWVLPKDHTVGRFNGYWKGATSIVQKENGFVYKKQTGYLSFPLLKNENDILKRLSGLSHFPSCRLNGDVLEIEDCGNPLTQKNVPSDWRDQIHNILNILNKYGVSHRDIKSDNLVCKDGVISLIDFGWSVTTEKRGGEFEGIENNPPSCLGFPNKPSYGFDDVYSMNRVEKQIEFMLEEESLCV